MEGTPLPPQKHLHALVSFTVHVSLLVLYIIIFFLDVDEIHALKNSLKSKLNNFGILKMFIFLMKVLRICFTYL